jgi:pteridine reductase
MAQSTGYQPMDGRVILITGGARRIGAAMSRGLHAAGADVVVHCRHSTDEAAALCEELETRREGSAAWLSADLLAADAATRLVQEAVEKFGRLDALINNASTFYPTPVGSITESDWEDLVGTNLKAPVFLCQAAAPFLAVNGGSILNLVDIHARRPIRDHAVYCAAKAGLVALTQALAKDLGPEIRVNAIAPGAILWPESGLDEAARDEIIARTALARAGNPEDIVACARYLLGDAGYVTGQVIAVDGGRSLGW